MAKEPKASNASKQLNASSPEAICILLVLGIIIVGAVFYFMFYSELSTKRDNTKSRISELNYEIAQLKNQEAQLSELRAEKERLEARLAVLRAKIPSTANELNYFLDSVNQRARTSRVSKWLLFKQEDLISHGEYSAVPIRMEFEATYEATIQFFWDLATMGDGMKNNSKEQIVNIHEVEITRSTTSNSSDNAKTMLRINCVAETYLYSGASAEGGH